MPFFNSLLGQVAPEPRGLENAKEFCERFPFFRGGETAEDGMPQLTGPDSSVRMSVHGKKCNAVVADQRRWLLKSSRRKQSAAIQLPHASELMISKIARTLLRVRGLRLFP